MRKVFLSVLCTLAVLLFIGCGNSGSGSTTRFRIHTQYRVNSQPYNDGGVITDAFCGDCFVWGYQGPLKTNFPLAYTDTSGWRTLEGGYLPANWNAARYQSARCPVPVINKNSYVSQDSIVPLFCEQQPYWLAAPTNIDAYSPPITVNMSGEAVVITANGMPKLDFYNEYGYVIGSVTVASVSADGSAATINTPAFLVNQYSGSYVAIINNLNPDFSYSPVAATAINIYNNDPPPPPPPDPCYLYSVGGTDLSTTGDDSGPITNRPIDPCL